MIVPQNKGVALTHREYERLLVCPRMKDVFHQRGALIYKQASAAKLQSPL